MASNNYHTYQDMQQGLTVKSESLFTLTPERPVAMDGIIQRLEQQTLIEGTLSYHVESEDALTLQLMTGEDQYHYRITLNHRYPLEHLQYTSRACEIDSSVQAEASRERQRVKVSSVWSEDPFLCWHMQLRVLAVVVPDMLLGQDTSAGNKLFTRQWLAFQTQTFANPALSIFYTLDAIDFDSWYWVHTHGMGRLGLPEIEINVPRSHDGLEWAEGCIDTFIDISLGDGHVLFHEAIPLAANSQHEEYLIALPWEQGEAFADSSKHLDEVRKLPELEEIISRPSAAQLEERGEAHTGPSCWLFHLAGQRGRLENCYAPDFDTKHPHFYRSIARTQREAVTARLRWPYFQALFEGTARNNIWLFMVKAAIPYDGGSKRENMWFIADAIDADSLLGELISEPVHVQGMQNGQRYRLELEQVVSWTINTDKAKITVDNIYQLITFS